MGTPIRIPIQLPFAVAATLFTAAAAAAQTDLRLSPRVGWLDPVGAFDEAARLDDGNYVSYDRIGGMALLGADLTLTSSSWWAVRLSAARTLGGDATGVWDCRGTCPAILLSVPSEVRVGVVAGELLLMPRPDLFGFRFFALVGAGAIRHRFEFDSRSGESISLAPGEDTRTDPVLRFGAGVRREGEALAVDVGLDDLVAWPERPSGGSQRSLALTAGFGFRIH